MIPLWGLFYKVKSKGNASAPFLGRCPHPRWTTEQNHTTAETTAASPQQRRRRRGRRQRTITAHKEPHTHMHTQARLERSLCSSHSKGREAEVRRARTVHARGPRRTLNPRRRLQSSRLGMFLSSDSGTLMLLSTLETPDSTDRGQAHTHTHTRRPFFFH